MTAAVGLPLLILLILKGSYFLFTCFILLLSLSGAYRVLPDGPAHRRLEGIAASLAGTLSVLALLCHDQLQFLFVIILLVILSCLLFLFRIRDIRQSAGEVSLLLMGFLYVPLLLGIWCC